MLRLRESKEELFNLRFQMATGQLDNNRRLRTVRHDIARIYTVMRERELGLSGRPDPLVRVRHERDNEVRRERNDRKVREGLVVSDKMDKTIVVALEDRKKHPRVLQGHALHHQGEGARRGEHRRRRRPRPADGDPAAVGHQALAPRRDPREAK